MKPLLLISLLFATCVMSLQAPTPNPPDGQIKGKVVDGDGNPVSGATVYLLEQSLSIQDNLLAQVMTDLNGDFDFRETLKHGVYEIYSRKEEEAYPDRSLGFYRPATFKPQTVQLIGVHPSVNVDVKLDEKAGALRGNVVDAETGIPLKAKVILTNSETEAEYSSVVNGKFRELVPANVDIKLRVRVASADYPVWSHPDLTLRLQPGEEKEFEIPIFKTKF
jgi:hypothetical protein